MPESRNSGTSDLLRDISRRTGRNSRQAETNGVADSITIPGEASADVMSSTSRIGQGDALISLASRYFSVSVITQGHRDPAKFTELSEWPDDDRWLLCSESRSRVMRWLVCEPIT